MQKDRRRKNGQSFNMIQSSDAAATYVNNSNDILGQQGQKKGSKGGNSKKDRPVWTYCGFTGHIANKCYKLQMCIMVSTWRSALWFSAWGSLARCWCSIWFCCTEPCWSLWWRIFCASRTTIITVTGSMWVVSEFSKVPYGCQNKQWCSDYHRLNVLLLLRHHRLRLPLHHRIFQAILFRFHRIILTPSLLLK